MVEVVKRKEYKRKEYLQRVKCPRCGYLHTLSKHLKIFKCWGCGERIWIKPDMVIEWKKQLKKKKNMAT